MIEWTQTLLSMPAFWLGVGMAAAYLFRS